MSNLPNWMARSAPKRTPVQEHVLEIVIAECIAEIESDHTGAKRQEFIDKYGRAALHALLLE